MTLVFSKEATPYHQDRRWLAPFTIINAIIMALVTLWHSQWPLSLGAQVYLVAGMIIHFSALSFAVTLCILAVGFLLRLRKHRVTLAVVLFALAQFIVIANVKVFSLYHFHLNGMVINLLLSGALLENIAFSWQMWVSIVAILISVLLGQRLFIAL